MNEAVAKANSEMIALVERLIKNGSRTSRSHKGDLGGEESCRALHLAARDRQRPSVAERHRGLETDMRHCR